MSSNAIQITPVNTRGQQKQFMQMAWDLYRGDPNWIPPLRMNQKELLNFNRHPFYDNAEIQAFLAEQNGKIVGRIAAIVDHEHNRQHDEKRGMFGFFESIEDEQISGALFQAVSDWHLAKGMDCLRGPLNPAMNHECGLLVDGFQYPPTFMMTYNKPYYGQLIEAFGYEKSQDLYAYLGHMDMLPKIDPKVSQIAEQAKERFDIKVRRISQKNFAKDVESFLDIYNKALPGTWGFVPLTQSELKHMAKGLKQLIVPEMTTIAEKDGKPIGCVFGLLDYNPIIKKIDGRLFPFGFMHLLFGRKKIKRVRLVSTNVVPEWQRWGIGLVLVNRLVEDIRAWGIEAGEFSWVLESNHLSKATLERGGAKLEKTYRIYDKKLT